MNASWSSATFAKSPVFSRNRKELSNSCNSGPCKRFVRKWRDAMPKRIPAEQLDQVISGLLAHPQEAVPQRASAAITKRVPIARALQDLPRPTFREFLKSDLQRRTTMSEA